MDAGGASEASVGDSRSVLLPTGDQSGRKKEKKNGGAPIVGPRYIMHTMENRKKKLKSS